jgi:hypothetical protein
MRYMIDVPSSRFGCTEQRRVVWVISVRLRFSRSPKHAAGLRLGEHRSGQVNLWAVSQISTLKAPFLHSRLHQSKPKTRSSKDRSRRAQPVPRSPIAGVAVARTAHFLCINHEGIARHGQSQLSRLEVRCFFPASPFLHHTSSPQNGCTHPQVPWIANVGCLAYPSRYLLESSRSRPCLARRHNAVSMAVHGFLETDGRCPC